MFICGCKKHYNYSIKINCFKFVRLGAKRCALTSKGFGRKTLDIFFADNPRGVEKSVYWRRHYVIFQDIDNKNLF